MKGVPSIAAYETLRVLGEGGMGTVYLARDPVIGRLVAIKWLRAGTDGVALRARLGQEARAAGRLNHPNIVTIFHVGDEGGRPCIVMEYVEGQSLADVIRDAVPLPLARSLSILEGVCAGLACAHDAGLIHRDIKPANIILDPTWEPKIVDFGLARVPDASVALTHEHAVLGTLSYMSPEQLSGGHVDHRSDLFALATVAYELTTLRRAFCGGTQAVIAQILNGSARALIDEAAMPEALAEVVARGMDRDPTRRFQSAADMGRAFGRVRERLVDALTSPNVRPSPSPLRPALPTAVGVAESDMGAPPVDPGLFSKGRLWGVTSAVLVVITLAVVYPRIHDGNPAAMRAAFRTAETAAPPSVRAQAIPPADAQVPMTRREGPTASVASVPGRTPAAVELPRSDATSLAAEPEVVPVAERLPVGTTLMVSVVTPLDSRRHSSGDIFDGLLEEPLTMGGKEIVAPGARVEGRVERSGVAIGGRPYLELSVTGIAIGQHIVPVRTGLYRAVAPATDRGLNVTAILIGGAAGATLGGIAGGSRGAIAGAAIGAAGASTLGSPAATTEYRMGDRLPFKLAEAIPLGGDP